MLFLVLADLSADFHTVLQQEKQVFVDDVDLGSELVDVLFVFEAVRVVVPDDDFAEHAAEIRRGELLLGIAEGA